MKLSEIEVGREYVDRWEERFRVVDKGNLTRRVFSGERADFGGHVSTSPCVKVQWLTHDGAIRNVGPKEYLTAAQVKMTWDEWQRLDAVRRKVENDLEDQFRALRMQAQELTTTLNERGVEASAIARRAGMGIEVTLTSEATVALIKALS